MVDLLALQKTRAIVEKVAPEELRVLEEKEFPHVSSESSLRGPMGIGFEVVFVLVSPLIYAFFESMAKEGGRLLAQSARDTLVAKGSEAVSKEDIAAFFESRGVDRAKSCAIAEEIISEHLGV